jgi:hypothetical protein
MSSLLVIAKQKLFGASRPFYTQSEPDSVEKDLRLNAYDGDNYR